MPAIAMAWSDQGLAALPGMRAGLQAAVRTLQHVMQQAGNLLILVTAVVCNKTGYGYLMAE